MVKSSDVYKNVPTKIEGVEIRVVKDTHPTVPDEVVEFFLSVARTFMGNKEEIKLKTEVNEELKEKIIPYVKAIPGLRGIRSSLDDLGLLAVEKEKVTWNRELLKVSLGVAYSSLVAEELEAKIMIPPGVISEEKLREGLERLLQEIGVPLADIPKLLEIETTLRIDTEKLDELVEAKRVNLLSETKLIKVEWAFNVERLKIPQKTKAEKKSKG